MLIEQIQRPAMSHPYIAVDTLGQQLIKEGFTQDLVYLIKDLIRLGDSTSLTNLRRINKKFNLNLNARNHQTASKSFAQELISNAKHHPLEEIHLVLLAGKEDLGLIDYPDRRYDEILGPIFRHRHFHDSLNLILKMKKPQGKKIALFTTCASVKPYAISPTFSRVFSYIDEHLGKEQSSRSIHWLVLSNATAPIPEELHSSFPFYAYETDLNQLTKQEIQSYKEVTIKRLTQFLEKFQYESYIGLLRPSHTQREVLEAVATTLNIDVIHYPTASTIKRIKTLGAGFWSRRGLTHEFTLRELTNKLTSLL
ncbi:MAG: DUF5591 domain-containing protein [Candidatus Hodarchaeales archaeon]